MTTSPSQLLRQSGIEPSGLKFAYNNNNISVSGTVAGQADGYRIREILAAIDGISGVAVDVSVAEPADVSAEPAAQSEAEATPEPAASAGSGSAEQRTYVVQSGDTLWIIAEKIYGSGSKYMKIYEANRDLLEDPDQIFPGQELKIPRLEG